jgi:IMP dehydrogenase
MAQIIDEVSRTFNEYLLIPGLTTKECTPDRVNLSTPITRYKKGEVPEMKLNIPIVSAIMQSVSNSTLAIALARNGGLSFIYGSQPIDEQAEMVRKVKKFKAGFVVSDANLKPTQTLKDVLEMKAKTGFSTIGITEDGTSNGKLLGMVTSRDYRPNKDPHDKLIQDFMTPFSKLVTGRVGI